MLKKLHLKTMLLLALMLLGASSTWADEVKYTISSLNTLTTTGTAPAGSSASIVETYSTSCQMTKGNKQTLTLKNYNGLRITKIVLSMKSNSKGGGGNLYYSTDGGKTKTYIVGSSSAGATFNTASWNGSWSTSYVDITKNTDITCTDDDFVIVISATANSIYCQSYTITYEATSALSSIALSGSYKTKFHVGDEFSFGGTVTATYENGSTKDVTTGTTFTGYDLSVAGSQTVTASFTDNAVTKTADYGINVLVPIATVIGDLSPTKVNLGDMDDFTLPITFAAGTDASDYEVTWTSSDATILELAGETYEAKKAGKVTVTVNVEPVDDDTYYAVSKEFSVKVVDPAANDGLSEAKAFTVAEAIDFYNDAESDYDADTEYYVKSTISSIGSLSSGALSYWLADDGVSDHFEVYKGKGIGGADFTSTEDLTVGDLVVVKGKISKYGSTYEFSAGSTLISRKVRSAAGIAWSSSDEVLIALNNDSYSLPTLTNPNSLTVTYSSSDENVAVVNETTGEVLVDNTAEGSTSITATFAGNTDYLPAAVSYDITVYDPNAKGTKMNPYTVAEVIAMAPSSTSIAEASDVYVKGYVVGTYLNGSYAQFSRTDKTVVTVMALADDSEESDNTLTIPVQLPDNEIRTAFNVKDNHFNVGVAQVIIKADVFKYFGAPGLKNPEEITKVAEKVNIGADGMATYYTDCALDFTGFDDMYAYTATVTSEGEITYDQVLQAPANTGLLLRNKNKAAASHVVPVAASPETVSENAFIGTLSDIAALATDGGEGKTNYILNKVSGTVGFYKAAGHKVGTHKAYLQVPAGVTAKGFYGFDDATAVEGIEIAGVNNVIVYNLQGQRVNDSYRGVVIVNGKKFVNK